jgi:hypothetical protein
VGALSGVAVAWVFKTIGVFGRWRSLAWFVLVGTVLGAIAYGYDLALCVFREP